MDDGSLTTCVDGVERDIYDLCDGMFLNANMKVDQTPMVQHGKAILQAYGAEPKMVNRSDFDYFLNFDAWNHLAKIGARNGQDSGVVKLPRQAVRWSFRFGTRIGSQSVDRR